MTPVWSSGGSRRHTCLLPGPGAPPCLFLRCGLFAAVQLPDTKALHLSSKLPSFMFSRWDLSSWPISVKLPKFNVYDFHPLEFVDAYPTYHYEISSLVGLMALWFGSDFGGAVLSQTPSVPEY